MGPQRFRSTLQAICVFICIGLSLTCDWDQSIDPNQGLDPDSTGSLHLDRAWEVSDPQECQAACCNASDCDLALVGYPADGRPQCLLVSCVIQGRDVCVLQASTQFKVYRKKVKTGSPEVDKPHIVPLLGSWEPRTNETNNIRCRLPMKVGSCRAAFPKFYYDVTNQSCRGFIYGGCEANGNNFDSQEECESTCSGVEGSVLPDESTPAPPGRPVKAARMVPAFSPESQDAEGPVQPETAVTESVSPEDKERCGAEPQVGPCRAMFQRWYYNRDTGSCQSFIYGGCGGNKNNYESESSCKDACTVTVLPSSKKTSAAADDDVSAEYKDHCMATPDPGPCRAAFPMYYYDVNTATCQSFIYGGCRGNHNRYSSMEECVVRCSTDAYFEHRGRARNRWTAAIFVFVALASISALLLTSLLFITLRRHRQSRRPSSVSDKEELLPEPDEHSSVESLTVPESTKPDKA